MYLTTFIVIATASLVASLLMACAFRRALLIHILPILAANLLSVAITINGYMKGGERLDTFEAGALWCICVVPANMLAMLIVPLIITHEKKKDFNVYVACITVFSSLVIFTSWIAVQM